MADSQVSQLEIKPLSALSLFVGLMAKMLNGLKIFDFYDTTIGFEEY